MLHSSLKTHDFSSLNVAVWRTGKLELFICSGVFYYAMGEPGWLRGLRQVRYKTTLQPDIFA